VVDIEQPPTGDNVRPGVLTALARPYATATNGTPTSFAYDPAARTMDYTYSTSRPDGSGTDPGLPTVLAMPPAAYPDGYTVVVSGAGVASAPGATELVLCNEDGATGVVVRVKLPGETFERAVDLLRARVRRDAQHFVERHEPITPEPRRTTAETGSRRAPGSRRCRRAARRRRPRTRGNQPPRSRRRGTPRTSRAPRDR